MVTEANKELLAKKMELENKWNQAYLLSGRVTVEMKPIEEQIRYVRRQMVSADETLLDLTPKVF
jgi:hypothetical protein